MGSVDIALPGGGQGAIAPKFTKFGQNSNFSVSDMKNLGKVGSFRAATMINYKK